jgi:transcriptional regulator with XRE-family HTH domain
MAKKHQKNTSNCDTSTATAPGDGSSGLEPLETATRTPRTLGFKLATKAYADGGWSLNRLATESGVSKSTLSPVMRGDSNPGPGTRTALLRTLGVPVAAWDRTVPLDAPADDAAPADSAAAAAGTTPVPPALADEEPAIDVCRANLSAIRIQLASGELSEQGRIRLLGLETGAARLLGRLTGELSDDDLRKFKQSEEYRHTVRQILGAILPFPDATAEVLRVVGASAKPLTPPPKNLPLDRVKIAAACQHVEAFISTDDLYPAIDDLVYPIADRERELVREDATLARRALASLTRAEPVLSASKLDDYSYGDPANYRRQVAARLTAELELDEMFETFRRDFGAVAHDRVREIASRLEALG